MRVLLACIYTWTPGVTGTHIENQSRTEHVGPSSSVVPSLRATACGARFANRCKDSISLLCVAEEGNVGIAEMMVNSRDIRVGVIQGSAVADEVVLPGWVNDVGHRLVCLKEL